ncbi:MAG: hypothetical protein Q7K55_00300 [Candidatus Levybacteria bacterium]|nr:hypothetical protein [Candidatus Levybacteria bacterium]
MEILNEKDNPFARGINQSKEFFFRGKLSGRLADGFTHASFVGTLVQSEVILVNRRIDVNLQKLLTKAREVKNQYSDNIRVAFELAKIVHERMESPVGESEEEFVIFRTKPYRSPEYSGTHLIGDIYYEGNKHGVCRHQSILFQVLAEDMGLDVTLRYGFPIGNNRGHMWNELNTGNSRYIIDCRKRIFDDYDRFQRLGGFLKVGYSDTSWYDGFRRLPYEHKLA